jgi:hypothetical protein
MTAVKKLSSLKDTLNTLFNVSLVFDDECNCIDGFVQIIDANVHIEYIGNYVTIWSTKSSDQIYCQDEDELILCFSTMLNSEQMKYKAAEYVAISNVKKYCDINKNNLTALKTYKDELLNVNDKHQYAIRMLEIIDNHIIQISN